MPTHLPVNYHAVTGVACDYDFQSTLKVVSRMDD